MILLILLVQFLRFCFSEAPDVTSDKYDEIIESNKLVFLYFYADWCRFTAMITPSFHEFADKLNQEITIPHEVFVGRVNYETEKQKCTDLGISKFPTFKLYRHGYLVFEEYKGDRTVESWMSYIKRELNDSIIRLKANESPFNLTKHDRFIVGKFSDITSKAFMEFKKTVFILHDECDFLLSEDSNFGGVNQSEGAFYGNRKTFSFLPYQDQFDKFYVNAKQFCTPLVKLLTFDNAQDFTQRGLALFILFDKPNANGEALDAFQKVLSLPEMKQFHQTFTFLHANGEEFMFPLNHLKKTMDDLPLLVIDSLRHMYVYPGELSKSNELKDFINRFLSGELHQQLHAQHGVMVMQAIRVMIDDNDGMMKEFPKLLESSTDVPNSMFKLLAPSKKIYSMKDEL